MQVNPRIIDHNNLANTDGEGTAVAVEEAPSTEETRPENLHTNNPSDKHETQNQESPPSWASKLRKGYGPIATVVAVVLHSIAALTQYLPFKGLRNVFDRASDFFSTVATPFVLVDKGLEAIEHKHLFKVLHRLAPPITFLLMRLFGKHIAVGNIGALYGFNSAGAFLGEYLEKLVPEFKEPGKTWKENNQAVMKGLGQIMQRIREGKYTGEDIRFPLFSSMMFVGTLGNLAAHDEISTWRARIYGLIRCIGGFGGDLELIVNAPHKFLKWVGNSCGLASVVNVLQRWVKNETLANALGHIGRSADDTGFTMWLLGQPAFDKMRNAVASMLGDKFLDTWLGKFLFAEPPPKEEKPRLQAQSSIHSSVNEHTEGERNAAMGDLVTGLVDGVAANDYEEQVATAA
jgi:hypothetical protein